MARWSVIIAPAIALLVSAASAWPQQGGDGGGFFLESIAPRESIAPTTPDAEGLQLNTNEYDVDLRLPAGLRLYRSFERSEVQVRDVVFGTGIAETTSTGASLSLGARTSMSFTRDERLVTDVFLSPLEEHTTTAMSFEQGFGGGSSAGTLQLRRALQVDATPGRQELRTLTQTASLQTGLGAGTTFSAAFTQRESEESPLRLQEAGYQADLRMALSGGEGVAHYDYLERLFEGHALEQRNIDLVMPLAVPGGTLSAEHHLKEQIADGTNKTEKKTSFVVPLDLVWRGARASYVEEAKLVNGTGDEKNVLTLSAPLRLLGHDATIEHIATETIRGSDWQEQRILRLSAQFAGSPGIIERTQTIKPAGDDVQHHERLRFQTPSIHLAEAVSLSADQVRDSVDGDESSRVSHVQLVLKPFDPMDVAANLTISERPGQPATEHRDVRTVLALAPSLNLRGSVTEQQRVDDSPIILRHLEVQRDGQSDADPDVRVGYTSYGAQQEDEETALLAQVSVGSETELGLNATYAEYDEKKLQPLAEPTTTVELRAGDPAELGMRAAFTEQASRAAPERTVGLAMGALGGALRLDYINNPLDPRGKEVMLSDVYELAFTRTVFGGVSMDVGYRYFLPEEGEDGDHFFKLRLDGGEVERGGKIMLSYLSGHYVPYPRSGDPPASLLDLTYEKRWPGDEGRLLLTLSRREAPSMSVGVDDDVEGEIKFETRF
ncbi:MAG: hypothetical protein AB7Y46_04765 [Armatimonadota bacterium]